MAGKAVSGAWTFEVTIVFEKHGSESFPVHGTQAEKFEVLAPDGLTALRLGLEALDVPRESVQQLGVVRLRRMLIAPATTKLLK
jgi:hypothetical protein